MISRAARATKFTKFLTPDSKVPTIEASEVASPSLLRTSRYVSGSYTWVAPESRPDFELKWINEEVLEELGADIDPHDPELAEILAGQKIVADSGKGIYPYASNYAGDQFGSWAGQLGDGRAITLFRIKDLELQLKGAGLTPYSRFADGKAVLRSSIREALACEYLNKLNIPTQRCLSLISLPGTTAHREKIESCAVITRMAPSWVRIGTFQLHHSNQDRSELRKLADYCIDELGLGKELGDTAEGNRYFDMFRDISLRNARMMAKCQAFGFLNGVLNTDNVSVLGLSIDYGPFAFMDVFNSKHTPNHDDYMNRYGFQNSPVVMWWNCVKLGEALGELIGAGPIVDDPSFLKNGVALSQRDEFAKRATTLIMSVGEEFQKTYETEYQNLMLSRMGLTPKDGNPSHDLQLVEDLLKMMEECELDYNRFFRNLAETQDPIEFTPKNRSRKKIISDTEVESLLANWFAKYNKRLTGDSMKSRHAHMNSVNPNFLLRNSILSNVIELAERDNWDAFDAVAEMALNPFSESWNVPSMYSRRYTDHELELDERDNQLSCSS